MKAKVYNLRPRVLFDIIYSNPKVTWAFTVCLDTILFYDYNNQEVIYLTINTEHLLNRLIFLTKKFNNLKYIKNGD